MNKRFTLSTRSNAVGLTAGTILALVVAMAIAFFFDLQPADAASGVDVSYAVSAYA